MRRTQTVTVLACFIAFLATRRGLETTQFITTASTLGVLALVDLRTSKGRAIFAETFWIGLFALNIGHDAWSTLYLILDLIWLFAGTAVIAWLFRRSEIARAPQSQSSSRS
jgi:hypothetical protein